MHRRDNQLIFSPTDLAQFAESPFVTWMERFELEQPKLYQPDTPSEMDNILARKGSEFELAFLDSLRAEGRDVFDAKIQQDQIAATTFAMQAGREVIYQASLKATAADTVFSGKADFLFKVTGGASSGSILGDYHYEPMGHQAFTLRQA